MLALDQHSPRAFEVSQGATLDANRGIQVNSLSEFASVVDHGGKAVAESFCVAGDASIKTFLMSSTLIGALKEMPLKIIKKKKKMSAQKRPKKQAFLGIQLIMKNST